MRIFETYFSHKFIALILNGCKKNLKKKKNTTSKREKKIDISARKENTTTPSESTFKMAISWQNVVRSLCKQPIITATPETLIIKSDRR